MDRFAAETPAVQVSGLVRRFGTVTALDGIELTVEAGQIFALLGPNGAGKTTLMHILATLLLPGAGTVRVFGADPVTDPARVRRQIGVAFQEFSLDGDMTGRELLELHGRLYRLGPQARRERIRVLVEALGLEESVDRRVGTYSGGMKRRLELARALLPSPRLLLLDEPTVGLDPQNREALWIFLQGLRDGAGKPGDTDTTIVMTTHYLEEAERLADRVAILDHGRILAEGAPDELVRAMAGEVIYLEGDGRLAALGEALVARGLALEWSLSANGTLQLRVPAAGPVLAEVIETARMDFSVQLQQVTTRRPSLHDVFIRLTGRSLRD